MQIWAELFHRHYQSHIPIGWGYNASVYISGDLFSTVPDGVVTKWHNKNSSSHNKHNWSQI